MRAMLLASGHKQIHPAQKERSLSAILTWLKRPKPPSCPALKRRDKDRGTRAFRPGFRPTFQ